MTSFFNFTCLHFLVKSDLCISLSWCIFQTKLMCWNFFVEHDCRFLHLSHFHHDGRLVFTRPGSVLSIFGLTSLACGSVTTPVVVVKSFLSFLPLCIFSLRTCHHRGIILRENFFLVYFGNFRDAVVFHSPLRIWKWLSFSFSFLFESFPLFLFLLDIFHESFDVFERVKIKLIVILTFWTVHKSMFLTC